MLFVVALALADRYEPLLQSLALQSGVVGMLGYVVVTVVAVVLAPVSTLPLLPAAVAAWGPFVAACLSIVGWTVGGVLAFLLARTFGRPLVARIVNMEGVDRLARKLVGPQPFFTLVGLRMLVPVDVLSYAVGLCIPMRTMTYTLATLIGVTPFGFIFSYTTVLSIHMQVTAVLCAFFIIALGFVVKSRRASTT